MVRTEEQREAERIRKALDMRRRTRAARGLPPVAPEDEEPVRKVGHQNRTMGEDFAAPSQAFWRSRWEEAVALARSGDEAAVVAPLRALYGDLPPDSTLALMARNLIRKVRGKGN